MNRINSEGSAFGTALVRDLSKSKKAQEDLRRSRDEAERANLSKSDFLSSMSQVKYNRPGGSVSIGWGSAEDGGVRIAVRADGIGIAADRIGQLFTPFERLGAETGSVEGTGIGLALSQSLVRLMGGEISVESAPGEGSEFHLRLMETEILDSFPAAGDIALVS